MSITIDDTVDKIYLDSICYFTLFKIKIINLQGSSCYIIE